MTQEEAREVMLRKRLDNMYNEGWGIGIIVGIAGTVAVEMLILVIVNAVGT